jgi:hypothetical protein
VWHGFFARTGGVSDPPFDSLNTAYRTSDPKASENRNLLIETLGLSRFRSRILNPCQGCTVAFLEDIDWSQAQSDVLIQTEAAFTRTPGTLFMMSTADCLPVLFTDTGSGFYGIAHFGWRNLMADYPETLLLSVCRYYGIDSESILVGIGPAVGPCCYRFENPVQRSEPFWDPFLKAVPDGRVAVDLMGALKKRLSACGVLPENLFDVHLCTACRKDLFFSCFRDGYSSGRFPTMVGLLPQDAAFCLTEKPLSGDSNLDRIH